MHALDASPLHNAAYTIQYLYLHHPAYAHALDTTSMEKMLKELPLEALLRTPISIGTVQRIGFYMALHGSTMFQCFIKFYKDFTRLALTAMEEPSSGPRICIISPGLAHFGIFVHCRSWVLVLQRGLGWLLGSRA